MPEIELGPVMAVDMHDPHDQTRHTFVIIHDGSEKKYIRVKTPFRETVGAGGYLGMIGDLVSSVALEAYRLGKESATWR